MKALGSAKNQRVTEATTMSTWSQAPTTRAGSLPYRPDIDGLRAIAVLAVVFFHFGVGPFIGGFAGVDVFFVISGYLITSLIQRDIRREAFSVLAFYERRIRRIVPALFLMVALVIIPSAIILLPSSFKGFGESLAALSVFLSNIEFWREAGYFQPGAQTRPLLHTWSVSVEEQFYLLFPAFLLLLRNSSKRSLQCALGSLFLASLAFSVWSSQRWTSAGFFSLSARFWEIALGALLAVSAVPRPSSRGISNALALGGAILIGGSFLLLSPTAPFPGYVALAPCVGTALVIYSGSQTQTIASRVIGSKPLAFVGRVSYSFYLLHWPLFALVKYLAGRAPDLAESSILIALSFCLAVLSWRFVELPFRHRKLLPGRRGIFRFAIVVSATAMVVGATIAVLDGVPQRFSPRVRTIAAYDRNFAQIKNACYARSATQVRQNQLCLLGKASVPPSFVLWGDSHAGVLVDAVSDAALARDMSGLDAAASGCVPFSTRTDTELLNDRCSKFSAAVLQRALMNDIDIVILAARWSGHLDDDNNPEEKIRFTEEVTNAVRSLHAAGKLVVLVADAPEVGWFVPERLALAAQWGITVPDAPTRDGYLQQQRSFFALADRLTRDFAVVLVLPHTVLCPTAVCLVQHDGLPIYYDDDHLSVSGARTLLEPLFAQVFARSQAKNGPSSL
jgi:peptidoglycan/LPS O-acetylase OafA/YrhL